MSSHNKQGGAASKKMTKWPRILDYLRAKQEKVYDLFDDLAMHGTLTPKRGGSITFLMPDDKYIAEIRKAIESSDPEKATDMLSSLILLDLFETADDFMERKDDIPNALYKKVTIKSKAGNKVEVADGTLSPNTEFKPFDRQGNSPRGNLAVWNLSGKIAYEKADKTDLKYAKVAPKAKPVDGGCDDNELHTLINDTIRDELIAIKKGDKGSDGVSPMLNFVARVLRGFRSDARFNNEKLKARSILTKHPIIDFYLLVKTPKVFNHDTLKEAWAIGAPDVNNNVNTIKEFFEESINCDGAVICNAAAYNEARTVLREQMAISNKSTINARTVEIYNYIDQNNKLPGGFAAQFSDKIYPDVVANIFRSKSGMHLALDEAIFFMYRFLRGLTYNEPTWESGRAVRYEGYREFFTNVATCFSEFGVAGMSMITRDSLIPNQSMGFITETFWREMGLHFPVPASAADSYASERVIRGGNEELDGRSKDLVDMDGEIDNALGGYDNSDFKLSNGAVHELKAYLKAHDGKFPTL